MGKHIVVLSSIILAGLVILSPMVIAQGMMNPHGGSSDTCLGGRDPGPLWGQDSDQGELTGGFRYRYGKGSPGVSLEDEEGDLGISISLRGLRSKNSTMEMEGNLLETPWTIDEERNDEGVEIHYRTEMQWKDEGDHVLHRSTLKMTFLYRWSRENRSIDMDIEILSPPGDSDIEFYLSLDPMGMGDTCCLEERERTGYGHMFSFSRKNDETLAELSIDREALISGEGVSATVPTSVDMENENDEGVLTISSSLPESVDSMSFKGSLLIFEHLLQTLLDAGSRAASYVIDHIISFTLGTLFLTVTFAAMVIYLSRKGKETGGGDLDLSLNRYFRKD
ncbi:MAG TPA: hypothetical protein ENK47_01895 [Euryarchaeota archaeon]|nr:hypothetical protein [Euryarchaeota archaeon]